MPAGQYKSLIKIQSPATAADASGQPDPDGWTDFLVNVRADILVQTGAETNRADMPVSEVKASIRIRFSTGRLGITAGMRAVHGSTVWDIKAVLPDQRGRQHIDLACTTGANNG